MTRLLPMSIIAVLWSAPLTAAPGQLPPVVQDGLKALRDNGAAAAVEFWTKSWTGPADSGKREQLQQGLGNLATYTGSLRDWDVLRTIEVTPHVKRYYLVLVFQRQPVYALFVVYRPEQDWIVTGVYFNTEASKVFPSSILEPERP